MFVNNCLGLEMHVLKMSYQASEIQPREHDSDGDGQKRMSFFGPSLDSDVLRDLATPGTPCSYFLI